MLKRLLNFCQSQSVATRLLYYYIYHRYNIEYYIFIVLYRYIMRYSAIMILYYGFILVLPLMRLYAKI